MNLAALLAEAPPTLEELLAPLLADWRSQARPNQLRPLDAPAWTSWQAGRGFGKTRLGAEHTLDIMELWGRQFHGGCAAQTQDMVRETLIEGPVGLIGCARARGYALTWSPGISHGLIEHPSGARLRVYSGGGKEAIRGPNTNYFWCDEIAYWTDAVTSWRNISNANRLPAPWPGRHGIITCTPRRRAAISKMIAESPDVLTIQGTSYENAHNMDKSWWEERQRDYSNGAGGLTIDGVQELMGELIDDSAGGWTRAALETHRVVAMPETIPDRICVALDPAVSSKATSDDSGLVAVAAVRGPVMDRFYVLADETLSAAPPLLAVQAALELVARLEHRYRCPVELLIEDNQGKEMWHNMVDMAVASGLPRPVYELITAITGKQERAELAAAVYEQGRVCHVGEFPQLESQMCTWGPGRPSPDRMDALVHSITRLEQGSRRGALEGY
jgi:phage terminase large subunit-like protein